MAEKGPKKFSRFMRHFPTTSYLRICQEEVNTKRALRNLSLSFHFYFRYIARFCREKKAIVFTGDSVFFVFELKGIVLIDGIKSLFHPRVYY